MLKPSTTPNMGVLQVVNFKNLKEFAIFNITDNLKTQIKKCLIHPEIPINLHGQLLDEIVGYISCEFHEKDQVFQVSDVWARKGYGPFLYYLVLLESRESGCSAYRKKNCVSPDAVKIWERMKEKGVKIQPLPKLHNDPVLDQKYILPPDLKTDIKQEKALGEERFRQILPAEQESLIKVQLAAVGRERAYKVIEDIYGTRD